MTSATILRRCYGFVKAWLQIGELSTRSRKPAGLEPARDLPQEPHGRAAAPYCAGLSLRLFHENAIDRILRSRTFIGRDADEQALDRHADSLWVTTFTAYTLFGYRLRLRGVICMEIDDRVSG